MPQLHPSQISATTARYILGAIFLVLLSATVYLGYMAQISLQAKALEVDHARSDAEFAQEEIQLLEILRSE